MDLFPVFYVLITLALLVILLISLYFYGRRTFAFFSKNGIEGPNPTAFIGNLKEMGNVGFDQAMVNWKKQFGDTFGIFIGSFPYLITNDPEIIGEVMVNSFSNFTNRVLINTVAEYTRNMVSSAKDDHWKYLRSVWTPSFRPFLNLINTVAEYTRNMVSSAKDDHWKYLRSVWTPSFRPERMREMVPLIDEVLKTFEKNVNKIVDSKEATDVTVLFSNYTLDVIASTGFGIKVDSQENPDHPLIKDAKKVFTADFSKSLQGIAILFPGIATIIDKVNSSLILGGMSYFTDYCKDLVNERKKEKNTSGRKDLLQLMLDAQLEGHEKLDKKTEQEPKLEIVTDWRTTRVLTDVEIISQSLLIFLAAFETTANTLSFFAHSIAMNRDIQEKLCQEIEEQLGQETPNYDNVQKLTYLDMCMDETLRKYPVAILLARKTAEDCVIKGIKIPKNAGFLCPVMRLHHDPRYWTEPERFDPERFNEENKAKQTPFTYLPFGAGPRICAGMRLAKLEFKMAVVHMLRKFRLVACDKTEEKIEFLKSGFLKAKNGIWIKIEHR